MFRTGLKIAAACGLAVAVPGAAMAYFPPPGTVKTTAVPPDPFTPPAGNGLGEPDAPEPTAHPTVSTPEPASIVSAATAMVLLAGYAAYRRRTSAEVV